jgi:chromosome segregation ATPase
LRNDIEIERKSFKA